MEHSSIDKAMDEVRRKAAEMRAEVTAQENRLIQDIENLHMDRRQQLDECEKSLSTLAERIQFSLETAKQVTSDASDSDFLSLYSTINKELTELANVDIPQVDTRLHYVKFKPSKLEGDVKVGEVLREGKWELSHEMFQGQGPFCARGVATRGSDEIAAGDTRNHQVAFFGTEGQYQTSISLQSRPWDIASMQDQLAVVEKCSETVKVFNADHTLALEFPTLPPSEVGKTDVDLWSVAVKTDGTLIVGDVKRKVLTEHRPDGTLLRTIPVDMKPSYLAVQSNGRVIISGETTSVFVIDGSGTTITTIKPTIHGKEVHECAGICSDSSGIYVAMHEDAGNIGHIHHYDAQGDFLKCIVQGLFRPRGITFTEDGNLVVADRWSVKMYHYV